MDDPCWIKVLRWRFQNLDNSNRGRYFMENNNESQYFSEWEPTGGFDNNEIKA